MSIMLGPLLLFFHLSFPSVVFFQLLEKKKNNKHTLRDGQQPFLQQISQQYVVPENTHTCPKKGTSN